MSKQDKYTDAIVDKLAHAGDADAAHLDASVTRRHLPPIVRT
ncbi:hypothetical protein [Bradyrhizobium pachyrhizi]